MSGRTKVADFYADRSGITPPLPWQTFSPTFSLAPAMAYNQLVGSNI
jgi:hypothetical protein